MTHLLVLVLNRPELIPSVTKAFRRIGVKGATVIDSVGMGRAKAEPQLVPLIAGLMRGLDEGHQYNKTILSVIEDEDILQQAITEVDSLVDFDQAGTGILFTVPVELVRGMKVLS